MGCELRRMLSGRGFLGAVVLCAAAILFGTSWAEMAESLKNLLEPGSFLAMEQKALCSKAVCFLLPVAAVLPWSDSFLAEWKGGFLKTSLPRQSRRVYVENKILAVALGGFLAWILAGVLVLFGYFVVFFPLEKRGSIRASQIWELAEVLLRCGLIGAIVASLGGICAVVTGSSYLAFGFPFVGYYFCIILQERYFPEALWLYPPQWISGSARWGERGEGLWLFLILFLAVSLGAHGEVLYGRLEEI